MSRLMKMKISSRTTPPRQQPHHPGYHLTPSSPFLHSHFARGSTATRLSKDDNSYLDLSGDSSQAYHYHDEESIYSAVRDSQEFHATSPHKRLANDCVVDDEVYDAGPYSPVSTVSVPDQKRRVLERNGRSIHSLPIDDLHRLTYLHHHHLGISVSYLYLQSASRSSHLTAFRYCGLVSFKWAWIATSRVTVGGKHPTFSSTSPPV
ncbi:hypothetical protein ARMGADRAFT_771890 [Armillaria gallica]|uniref:Uncharacterized protein n=1 Tax=Armillaria gallica TaxID=47427 RepID=A0A2H3D0J2_ARMGA|nr:hypothetical protein ARMGADRAFT_771890 [Armillaria gallica]